MYMFAVLPKCGFKAGESGQLLCDDRLLCHVGVGRPSEVARLASQHARLVKRHWVDSPALFLFSGITIKISFSDRLLPTRVIHLGGTPVATTIGFAFLGAGERLITANSGVRA
jgi:hypothetical protein